MTLPDLFAAVPKPLAGFYDPQAPWALLGDPLDEILSALPSDRIEGLMSPDVHLSGDKIVIEKGARVGAGTTLEGPIYVGPDAEIRPGAYLRGGCYIGAGAVVGASTEVKRAILFPRAHAPHLNYVGDSILGEGVNLGAGTILSNFRHDGADIEIPTPDGGRLATGRRKLGAVLGDRVLTGCNCVLNPGCIVGSGTQLYPLLSLRSGVYAADHIVKLRQTVQLIEQRR